MRDVLPALWDVIKTAFRPQSEPVRAAFVNLVKEIRLARATTAAAPQFHALRGRTGLKLHLGCGSMLKDGWVNLDLNLDETVPELPPGCSPNTRFILTDLRSGRLALDDGSCELIYSSHFFEHLEYDEGVRLMRECHRVLQPGGTFRAALPDFPGMFRAYVNHDEKRFDAYSIFDVFPYKPRETVTLVDHVNYGVYQFGQHKFIYDEDKICRVLRHIGFGLVDMTDYRDGIDPAGEIRRRYSFYVEARK